MPMKAIFLSINQSKRTMDKRSLISESQPSPAEPEGVDFPISYSIA